MYHPELTQVVGFVLAFSLVGYLVGCFLYGYTNQNIKPIKFTDKFELGYIEDNENLVPIDVMVTDPSDKELVVSLEKQLKTMQAKLSKMEKKASPKPKPKPEEDQLFNDCVATLITLGYKSKRVAKNDVSDFLTNNDITSVDQFVAEFFKKAKKF